MLVAVSKRALRRPVRAIAGRSQQACASKSRWIRLFSSSDLSGSAPAFIAPSPDNHSGGSTENFMTLLERIGGVTGVNQLMDPHAHMCNSNDPAQPVAFPGDLRRYISLPYSEFKQAFPTSEHLAGLLSTEYLLTDPVPLGAQGLGVNVKGAVAAEPSGSRSLMIRTPGASIIKQLQSLTNSTVDLPAVNLRFYLDGTAKCGKSASLNHVVLWARLNGWLVLSLPNAWTSTNAGARLRPAEDCPEVHAVSAGTVHQSDIATAALAQFRSAHEPALRSLRARRAYSPQLCAAYFGMQMPVGATGGPEVTTVPAVGTLLQLVDAGLGNELLATAAFVDLRLELSLVTEYPVLLAIDQYNAFMELPADDFFLHGKRIFPEQLAFVRTMSALHGPGARGTDPLCPPLARGAVVAAASYSHPFKYLDRRVKKQWSKPSLDCSATVVEVPRYSDDELRSAALHYENCRLLRYRPDSQELGFLKSMTGARGGKFLRHCATYQLPYGMMYGPGEDAKSNEVDLDDIDEHIEATESRAVRDLISGGSGTRSSWADQKQDVGDESSFNIELLQAKLRF